MPQHLFLHPGHGHSGVVTAVDSVPRINYSQKASFSVVRTINGFIIFSLGNAPISKTVCIIP